VKSKLAKSFLRINQSALSQISKGKKCEVVKKNINLKFLIETNKK